MNKEKASNYKHHIAISHIKNPLVFLIPFLPMIFYIYYSKHIIDVANSTYNNMNNLQIFRRSVDEFLQSDNIASIDKWHEMLEHLCNLKIFSPQEIKVLNQNVEKRSFPIGLK